MRKFCCLISCCLLVCIVTSCQKGSRVAPSKSSLILGKWNLQQQKTVIYADNVKQTDTLYTASATHTSAAWFNANGTFSTAGYYLSSADMSQDPAGGITAIKDSTFGTYQIVGSSFNTNVAIAGFRNMIGFYDVASSSGAIPAVNLVSRSSQIIALTNSEFNLHFEMVYNTIINDVTTNYKEEEDYYYTR